MQNFITVTDLEDFIGKTLPSPDAETAIAAGQTVVRDYLQQEITYHENDVEYHDGTGKRVIRLRERPVRFVTSVEVDGLLLPSTDWKLRKSRITGSGKILLTDGTQVFLPGQEAAVTYSHGWDAVPNSEDYLPVPEPIKRAALSVSRREYIGRGPGDENPMRMETIGSYSYQVSTGGGSAVGGQLSDSEKEMLDWYVIRLAV